MMEIINIVRKVIPENSALIFDSGGNTKKNKERIRSLNYHYLTLKPKKVRNYRRAMSFFNDEYKKKNISVMKIGSSEYFCAKKIVTA
jgi:arginine deiminase